MATEAVITGSSSRPVSGRWGRRLISLPMLFVGLAVLVGLSPLLLPVALVYDLVRRTRGGAVRTVFFVGFYLSCEVLGVIVAGAIWVASAWRGRERFLDDNFRLQCVWGRIVRRGSFALYGMRVQVAEGADCVAEGPMIVLARHASLADTMLPVMLISDRHGVVLRWVMKQELLWDPCLDVVGHRLRNCFVTRLPEEGDRDIAAVASLADDLGPADGVLIYPEGTRFSHRKRERVLERFRRKGDKVALRRAEALETVLPPRLGGVLALLDRDLRADVVFLAHRGLEAGATLGDLVRGGLVGKTIDVALWRVARADVPAGAAARIAWLHEQWQRVDAFVAEGP